jgi:hypothetical protein
MSQQHCDYVYTAAIKLYAKIYKPRSQRLDYISHCTLLIYKDIYIAQAQSDWTQNNI